MKSRYGSKGLVVLGVARVPAATQTAYARSLRANFPMLIGTTSMPAPYNRVAVRPTQIMIDRRGLIREVVSGYQAGALEPRVTALLASR